MVRRVSVANTTLVPNTTGPDNSLNSRRSAKTVKRRTDGGWWFVFALGAVTLVIFGLLRPIGERPR